MSKAESDPDQQGDWKQASEEGSVGQMKSVLVRVLWTGLLLLYETVIILSGHK
jgi:hypothetical protein